jgi:hypothetical protein
MTAPAEKDAGTPKASTGADRIAQYGTAVGEASKWVVGALAAAGAFVVADLGIEKIDGGDYSDGRALELVAAVLVLALGASLVVASYFLLVSSWRVTLHYIQRGNASGSQWQPANRVRKAIDGSPHLLNGAADINAFAVQLSTLVAQRADATGTAAEQVAGARKLRLAIGAKEDILATARAERMAATAWNATLASVVGTLLAAGGGVGFALVTNDATRAAEAAEAAEEDAPPPPSLVPPLPGEITFAVPDGIDDVAEVVGPTCELDEVQATAFELSAPPEGIDPLRVMRTFVHRTDACEAGEVWIEPGWVLPADDGGGSSDGATTTTAPSTTTTTTEPDEGG